MGSRVRKGKHRLFELFVEVTRSPDNLSKNAIGFRFPAEYKDEELLKSIPGFAFPCASDFSSSAVDLFTFVLTDIDSKFRFGFCRLSAQAESCLCIVSYYPWFEVFYRLLNYVAELQKDDADDDVILLLRSLFDLDASVPGTILRSATLGRSQVFRFTTPDSNALPSIPDNRNLTEYYNAIDSYNMMIIFASMLFERRILVTSRKLSRLTACVHGAASLFYPFHWQHLYIPVLPPHLIDYCSAPMPYLIGVHSSLIAQLTKAELGDAVILDADSNTLSCGDDDLSAMPPKVVAALKKDLRAHKKNKVATPCVLTGQTVSRAFLRTLVRLLGGYRNALVEHDGELTFDPEAFVQSGSLSMQPFLERLLQVQALEQFVSERMQLLSDNPDFMDDFEEEIFNFGVNVKQLGKSKNKVWPKYEKQLIGIASMVKSTGKSTIKTMRTTLNDFGADITVMRRRQNDTSVKIVVTPATNDKMIAAGSANGGPTVLSALKRESRLHSVSPGELSRRHNYRVSTDDGEVLGRLLHQVTLPLLTDREMENMFRKYSVDNLLDGTASLSGESDMSRDNLSLAADNLSMDMDSLKFFDKRDKRNVRQSPLELNVLQGKNVSCSTPDIAECVDYPEYHNSSQRKTNAAATQVSEYKIEINHDGIVTNQQQQHEQQQQQQQQQQLPSFKFTFTSEELAKQKTDLVSELNRPPENSEPSQNIVDRTAEHVKHRDKTIDKTVDQSDFHDRRKYRLSVKYLPNVQQIIERYEKTPSSVPSTATAVPVKQSVRTHPNESSESLVSRQAARYMSLDRNARLEINFEPPKGSNGRTCDSRKQMEPREHTLLSSSSSNSSIISSTSVSTSVYVGSVDISTAIESSACDLQLNSFRVTPG